MTGGEGARGKRMSEDRSKLFLRLLPLVILIAAVLIFWGWKYLSRPRPTPADRHFGRRGAARGGALGGVLPAVAGHRR